MFFQVRKLLLIISFLKQVKQAKSESEIPSFVYKPFQPATSSPTEFEYLLQFLFYGIMHQFCYLHLLFQFCFSSMYFFGIQKEN